LADGGSAWLTARGQILVSADAQQLADRRPIDPLQAYDPRSIGGTFAGVMTCTLLMCRPVRLPGYACCDRDDPAS